MFVPTAYTDGSGMTRKQMRWAMKQSSVAPHLGVHFPLADFERQILADPDVLGMMYNGSLGRGDGDRYSDLDISLWLRDEALAKPSRIEHYVGWLGEIQ